MVDPLGNVTTVAQDELGREVERRDPMGNVTRTGYDELGRRESVTDPAGYITSFGYDDAGRLTTVTDAKGGVTSYGYDGRGNRTSVTDANHHTTSFDYDLANRLQIETVPSQIMTTQYGYDPAGNRTSKLDGKNQTTGFVYDDNRRLTDINYASGTPAHFAYDNRGNKTLEKNDAAIVCPRSSRMGPPNNTNTTSCRDWLLPRTRAAGPCSTPTTPSETDCKWWMGRLPTQARPAQ
jgi:YD repeat-containing protein